MEELSGSNVNASTSCRPRHDLEDEEEPQEEEECLGKHIIQKG